MELVSRPAWPGALDHSTLPYVGEHRRELRSTGTEDVCVGPRDGIPAGEDDDQDGGYGVCDGGRKGGHGL